MRRKWFFAGNSLAGFLLLGLNYGWSVFVRPLEMEFGWTRSQTSMAFSICMTTFCLGGLSSGWLLKKMSPRQAILLSAFLILAGLLSASRVQELYALYFFYGVLCGLGTGVGYNVLLDSTLRWFPGQQGLISGVLLMGFGMSGSLTGSAAIAMMNVMTWRQTFTALGLLAACLLAVISLNVKKPPSNPAPPKSRAEAGEIFTEIPTREMLRDRSFYAYYFRSLFVAAVGLAMIGNAAPFVQSVAQDPVFAANIAGLVSFFSGVGRVAGGFVFDRIGSRKTLWIGIAAVTLGVAVLTAAAVSASLVILIAGYVMGGFFYGANVPCNASYTNKIYGQENFAMNLGIMNTNVLFASFLGPYVTGVLFTRTGTYAVPYLLLLALCGGGVAATALLERHYSPPPA